MQITKFSKKQVYRVLIVPLIMGLLASVVMYDRNRVIADFDNAKKVLTEVRLQSLSDGQKRTALFRDKHLVITEVNTVISDIELRTLHSVNYDTTTGDDMVVFTARGTSDYNKKIHGGDITFKSWFGFKKYLWVNCTGYVTEGKMKTE